MSATLSSGPKPLSWDDFLNRLQHPETGQLNAVYQLVANAQDTPQDNPVSRYPIYVVPFEQLPDPGRLGFQSKYCLPESWARTNLHLSTTSASYLGNLMVDFGILAIHPDEASTNQPYPVWLMNELAYRKFSSQLTLAA